MARRRGAGLQAVTLAVVGIVVVIIGGNVALGGFDTLGLQFPPAGLSAADPLAFQRHDSNARFLGGIFAGAGLLIGLAAAFAGLRPTAAALLLLMPLGGLARLVQPDYAILADPVFYASLIAEFIAAPLFALWIWRSQSRLFGA